jgi:tetratricopeptide (TPR) repeat protein
MMKLQTAISSNFKMSNRYRQSIGFGLIGGLVLILSLAGCAANPVQLPDIPALNNQPKTVVPSVDLLFVSPEMREFAHRYGRSERATASSAWSLVYAALDPYLLNFEYDPLLTLPADQAFKTRAGNCLTFSSLFVAMAREIGLKAWYQEVKIPPQWSNINDTMLVSMHVNAVVQDRRTVYTVDVSRKKIQAIEQVRRLSDSEARAQYYNNLGVDALIGQDLALAYAYFIMGLDTEPRLAFIWSNLGVVLRRNEQPADAILAYQTAAQLDPRQTVALNNLYAIYDELGELELAQELKPKIEKYRRKNPYYLHYLAEIANEEQRYSDAINLLNRALRIDSNEYRFYFTLAQSQFHSGRTEVAQASLDEARRLAPPGLQGSLLILPGDSL